MILSLPQSQHDIHYLGIPYMVEHSYYGFWAVFDVDDENVNTELEGKILDKFFKYDRKRQKN